jgi:hypothetical protein
MLGAGLASLSDIPVNPDWRFPGLSFDASGFALPPDWSNEFVALKKSVDPEPGEISEPWNTFALADWVAGDSRYAQDVFEQHTVDSMMSLIRGR